jgi:hypothetical protein
MTLEHCQELYGNSEHEVAVHGVHHPYPTQLSTVGLINEFLEDRRALEQQFGGIIRGMAYPFGQYNDEVINVLKKCGIVYARTVHSTTRFSFPDEWMEWHPTCHHGNPELMNLAKRFVEEQPWSWADNWLFYVWGHSFEFERNNDWERIEEFAEYINGKDDIWYATNIEIYDYVQAYRSLQVSADETVVHNPTAQDVWFAQDKVTYCVKAGETITLK